MYMSWITQHQSLVSGITNWFTVQSAPSSPYWVLADYELYNSSCMSQSCIDDCKAKGQSMNYCENACAVSQECLKYVESIKWNEEITAAAAEAAGINTNIFKLGKTAVDPALAVQQQEKKPAQVNPVNYGVKIAWNYYSQQCEEYRCVNFCVQEGGELDSCNSQCVSDRCLNVKAKYPTMFGFQQGSQQ